MHFSKNVEDQKCISFFSHFSLLWQFIKHGFFVIFRVVSYETSFFINGPYVHAIEMMRSPWNKLAGQAQQLLFERTSIFARIDSKVEDPQLICCILSSVGQNSLFMFMIAVLCGGSNRAGLFIDCCSLLCGLFKFKSPFNHRHAPKITSLLKAFPGLYGQF